MQSNTVIKRESLNTEEAREILKRFIANHSTSNVDYCPGSQVGEYSTHSNSSNAIVVPDDVLMQLKVVKLHLDSAYPH
eukprot:g1198.t1